MIARNISQLPKELAAHVEMIELRFKCKLLSAYYGKRAKGAALTFTRPTEDGACSEEWQDDFSDWLRREFADNPATKCADEDTSAFEDWEFDRNVNIVVYLEERSYTLD
jgi:hypothetical protein